MAGDKQASYQKILDLLQGQQHQLQYNSIRKCLKNRKCIVLKKLNLQKGRLYYPGKRSRRSPSQYTLLRNTAINSFSGLKQLSESEIAEKIVDQKQRELEVRARMEIDKMMKLFGPGLLQKTMQEQNFDDDEDDEDYESDEDDEDDE
ncbi:hypothetical protein DLAC_01868 [Tieghemostelium lacteum]|uniref:Uncharacterized protein n=1 Tax=Tieghemostelium lacteum TaxID=361077 RepID=A0A152A6V4_TIELA|nr:hypothetical protein DLAC_01868 [Tieghemostelium lacteum]|eukprot:KYR01851.1 hypothetical protein DLAC_01868 [Tieghemostelium lacteum]